MIRLNRTIRSLALLAGIWLGGSAFAGNLIYFNDTGVGGTPRKFYGFDPTTGISTQLSVYAGPDRFYGLDRQPSTGQVFGIEPLTSKLYKINPNTGASTLVGGVTDVATGVLVNTVISIAFDPTTGILYGFNQASPFGLFTIDPNTAAANLVGVLGQQRRGLCCDATGQLYCFGYNGRLYSVSSVTGGATPVGGGGGAIAITADGSFTPDGKLYATDQDGSIHQIDPTTGIEIPVGNTGLGSTCLGLVDAGATCSGAVTPYCTGKVNSLGCTPSITGVGTPSATAGSGFSVKGSQVRNQKNGLLFYGTTGQASTPYQNGTLCVKSPIKRTGSQSSGGSPAPAADCSGIWSIDMNSFAVSAGPPVPLAALQVPGTIVYCQWWGRDPGFAAPNNTQLSNGLTYTICP